MRWFFLNYIWIEQKLASSRALAGELSIDVYVGIDVLGTECYGGGGLISYKISIATISREGLIGLAHCCIVFQPTSIKLLRLKL